MIMITIMTMKMIMIMLTSIPDDGGEGDAGGGVVEQGQDGPHQLHQQAADYFQPVPIY
jgi:hypothetical protein